MPIMTRRTKFPRNREQRKSLIGHLVQKGWPLRKIRLLIGYALTKDERKMIENCPFPLLSFEERMYLSHDEYRRITVEKLLDEIEEG